MKTEIELRGGTLILTKSPYESYEVIEGNVLVYILPLKKDGTVGRRMVLAEMQKGEFIPSLCYNAENHEGNICPWHLGLVAIDVAKVAVHKKCTENICIDFLEKAGIRNYEELGFEESMVEAYCLDEIRELRNVFRAQMEREETNEKLLHLIYSFFYKKELGNISEPSGNKLYDTMSFLCDKRKIDIAPFEKVKETCGKKITAKDIARISNFICRDIILQPGWHKKDSGAILAFKREGKGAVACIPKGTSKYIAYDLENGSRRVIDDKYADTISPNAYTINKPFPSKELKMKEVMKFGLKSIYISDIVWLLIFTFIGTLIGLLVPYVNEQLYDTFIPIGDASGLIGLGWVLISCMIGKASFELVKSLHSFRSMSAMKYSVQNASYQRLFNLSGADVRDYDSADICMRAASVSSIFEIILNSVTTVGISSIFSFLYLFRMFKYSKKLAQVSLIMLIITMLLMLLFSIKQVKYEKVKLNLDTKSSAVMYQLLAGISKIRIAGVENRALYEYMKPYTKSCEIDRKKERLTISVNILKLAANTIFSIILYFIMIRKNVNISMGSFVAFTTAFGAFSGSMLELCSKTLDLNNLVPMFKYVSVIFDVKPEVDEAAGLPGNLTGDIEISNVTFSYTPEGENILKNLSLHIKKGEYIGVVGPSGCGKSTLLKLLLGFEKPTSGKIYYDGQDIDKIDKRELRKKFGVVLQDGGLIAGSIYENITITSPGASLKRVEEVIKEVGLKEDISAMPMGLHTMLSEGDGGISGGQRQRILIARAMVGKPNILFFDEATSALDNVTQSMVCDSLMQLEATRFVIAHRLSTVMNCDRIIVLDSGEIVESGSYQELMDLKGRFYELAKRQMV